MQTTATSPVPGWSFRALLLDLDDWAAKGTRPPDSAYAHLTTDLVSRESSRVPQNSGCRVPPVHATQLASRLTARISSAKGSLPTEPPKIGQPYTVLVPSVNSDGNDLGGIQLPHVAVPLGTFTGWNYQLPVRSNLDYLSGLVGSFIPFKVSAEDRKNLWRYAPYPLRSATPAAKITSTRLRTSALNLVSAAAAADRGPERCSRGELCAVGLPDLHRTRVYLRNCCGSKFIHLKEKHHEDSTDGERPC